MLTESICECGCGRFVNNTIDGQSGDPSSVFCSLPLDIVEVGRHCDNRFADFLPQKFFSRLAQPVENNRRDFGRAVIFSQNVAAHIAGFGPRQLIGQNLLSLLFFRCAQFTPDEALDGVDGVPGVSYRLAFGN